jgi:hypothetical protein
MRRFPLQGCGSEDHVAREGGQHSPSHAWGGGEPARQSLELHTLGPTQGAAAWREAWAVDRERLVSGECNDCRPGAADENSAESPGVSPSDGPFIWIDQGPSERTTVLLLSPAFRPCNRNPKSNVGA